MNFENNTKHKYEFSISGDVKLVDSDEFTSVFNKESQPNEKAIHLLNSRKYVIADKISSAIERQLPPEFSGSVKIETAIEFGQGSITWIGIITVLDWIGKIVDTVTFVQLMTTAIQFAVNKVIAEEASQNSISIQFETIYTRPRPTFTPSSQEDLLYRDMLTRQDEQLRILRGLWRNLDTLLMYIGQLRDRNSAFRLSSYNNRPVQQPRWISRDLLFLIALVFIFLILSIDYFNLDTIREWFFSLFGVSP